MRIADRVNLFVARRAIRRTRITLPQSVYPAIRCSPGTVSQSENGDRPDWADPNNVKAPDGSLATVTLSDGQSTENLNAQNFGFGNLPAGATISGIVVGVRGRYTGDMAVDLVRLINAAGAAAGGDRDTELALPQSADTCGLVTVGEQAGITGLTQWNLAEAPSVDDVQNANWGIRYRFVSSSGAVTIAIDHLWMEIHYTP